MILKFIYSQGDNKMSNRTKKTENNTMVYLVEDDTVETSHAEEDLDMDLNTSIVLFTMYPELVEDGDTTMPMEHGMVLLETALAAPTKLERSAIVGIVIVIAAILSMDKLANEAIKLLSDNEGITSQFCAYMGPEIDDISGHYKVIDQLLEWLGIDSSKKKRAMDEIFIIFRVGEEL